MSILLFFLDFIIFRFTKYYSILISFLPVYVKKEQWNQIVVFGLFLDMTLGIFSPIQTIILLLLLGWNQMILKWNRRAYYSRVISTYALYLLLTTMIYHVSWNIPMLVSSFLLQITFALACSKKGGIHIKLVG